MADRLLTVREGPSAGELLLAAITLSLVAIAAYGAHVLNGGFYSDDWANAAGYRFSDDPRYWSSVADLEKVLGGRPLLALLLPIPHALFGVHPDLHLALALVLGVLLSLCFYALLRTLEMAPLHAAAIAVLTLLFPWSDSIRLWATASINALAVCFFLIGLALALRGLERGGAAGVAMHVAADLLYLLSVLTYEVTAAAALLGGFLYLGRARARTVIRRWIADCVVVLGALAYSLAATVSSRHVGSIGERLGDVSRFAREAALLLVSAVEPFGSLGKVAQGAVLLVAAGVAVAVRLRLPDERERWLREWARWALVGVVALAAAYFMFLGSHLHPRDPGIDNRINIFAGPALCLLAYALVAAASGLFLRSERLAASATVIVVAAIGIGYGLRTGEDGTSWDRAASRQQEMLRALERALAPLPSHSAVLTFGFPAQTAPEVPVFNRSWDLSGALRLQERDQSIRGLPVYQGVAVRCGERLVVDGGAGYGTFRLEYGRLFFVDSRGRVARVRSARDCVGAIRRFRAGRLEL